MVMGKTTAPQQTGGPAVTQERATIRINDIPTELLERLLGKYVQQVNENYKKTQGDLEIPELDESSVKKINVSTEPKKRTLAEVDATFDNTKEAADRTVYSNDVLPLYGCLSYNDGIKEISTKTDEPMADVLKAAVLQIMDTSMRYTHKVDDVNITANTASLMSIWAAQFFHILTTRLQRLMEIQRRRFPNRDDLNLLLREGYFDNREIEEMLNFCKKYWRENSCRHDELQRLSAYAVSAFTGRDDGKFNTINDGVTTEEAWWIDQIVHRKKRKPYIPEWMPPLPPEHTFKSTPKYSQRVTNPVILREKLVVEGRFGEKALDHIIVKEDSSICSPLSEESISSSSSSSNSNSGSSDEEEAEQQEDQMQEKDAGNEKLDARTQTENNVVPEITVSVDSKPHSEDKFTTEKVASISGDGEEAEEGHPESPASSDKKVDLVELAHKRMAILEKRRKDEEQRYLSRVESDESRFGRNFGFYTNVKKLPDDINIELHKYRTKKLKELVHRLHKQEKKNAKWVIEQEELRRKIDEEKSKYAEANEIQLGTGAGPSGDNLFYADMDEEVDFDVEFSDMEEINDGDNAPQVTEEAAILNKSPEADNHYNDDIHNNNKEKLLSVRFQDEVDSSVTPLDKENKEVEEIMKEDLRSSLKEDEDHIMEDIAEIGGVSED